MARSTSPGRPRLPRIEEPSYLNAEVPVRAFEWSLEHDIHELHRHEALELGYCRSGYGVYLIEDKMFQFSAGCAAVIGPQEFHRARSLSGDRANWMTCFLAPERVLSLAGRQRALLDLSTLHGREFPNLLTPDRHPELCQLIRMLCEEAAGRHDLGALQGLTLAVMAQLQLLPGRSCRSSSGRGTAMERIAPVLSWFDGHSGENVPIPRLAALCRTSVPNFHRWFRMAMGMTPKRYLLELRIHRAAALMRSRRISVLRTAIDCGFASANGFSRRFRAIFGCTPREWRAGHAGADRPARQRRRRSRAGSRP